MFTPNQQLAAALRCKEITEDKSKDFANDFDNTIFKLVVLPKGHDTEYMLGLLQDSEDGELAAAKLFLDIITTVDTIDPSTVYIG